MNERTPAKNRTRAALSCLSLLLLLVIAAARPTQAAEPANTPATLNQLSDGRLEIKYQGATILAGHFHRQGATESLPLKEVKISNQTTGADALTQQITITLVDQPETGIEMAGVVFAGPEAFAAETLGPAQTRFPLVRNSVGPSRNLRNNAVYDRGLDWSFAGTPDHTRVIAVGELPGERRFSITTSGPTIELTFRPRFYQRHKGIKFFRPWEYQVKQTSVTGWCSWWAYMSKFSEQDLDELLAVWKQQRLVDYGLDFIQIDDTYQRGTGLPDLWLNWNAKFPSGINGYVSKVKAIGADPGVWVNASFPHRDFVDQYRDWFARDPQGQPWSGKWVGYVMDATVPGTADNLIRPLYRGLHQAGFGYVKIDGLRHLLYDGLHSVPTYAAGKGTTSEEIYREYLRLARQELGPDTFVLGCWGVIPESVGLVDADRLGGDGFGPATLQQYNSWNGVVWRNDPDHCDVRPSLSDNVPRHWFTLLNRLLEPRKLKAPPAESIIRPVVASMAGAVLLISDKARVYRDPANLFGVRRSSPVLFTVPGQLYDYEPSRTDALKTLDPSTLLTGGPPSPIDARQSGNEAEWWLLEIDRPFENWTVLSRLNWEKAERPAVTVNLADLGLEPDRDYLVFEFWTNKFLGVKRGSFASPAIASMGTQTFAIRELYAFPQLVSTNRHISQGGVDIVEMKWDEATRTLSGRSKVVAQDRYELVIHLPAGFNAKSAEFDGRAATVVTEGELIRVAIDPAATGEVSWQIKF